MTEETNESRRVEIGGKIFAPGSPIDPEELAAARATLADFNRRRAAYYAQNPPDQVDNVLPARFSDDLVGTEYEGWTRERKTGQWYDKNGQPVTYDATSERYFDKDGRPLAYDKVHNEWRPQ